MGAIDCLSLVGALVPCEGTWFWKPFAIFGLTGLCISLLLILSLLIVLGKRCDELNRVKSQRQAWALQHSSIQDEGKLGYAGNAAEMRVLPHRSMDRSERKDGGEAKHTVGGAKLRSTKFPRRRRVTFFAGTEVSDGSTSSWSQKRDDRRSKRRSSSTPNLRHHKAYNAESNDAERPANIDELLLTTAGHQLTGTQLPPVSRKGSGVALTPPMDEPRIFRSDAAMKCKPGLTLRSLRTSTTGPADGTATVTEQPHDGTSAARPHQWMRIHSLSGEHPDVNRSRDVASRGNESLAAAGDPIALSSFHIGRSGKFRNTR